MPTVVCEYDGTTLTLTAEGFEPACPTCEADIWTHRATCWPCKASGDAPEFSIADLALL